MDNRERALAELRAKVQELRNLANQRFDEVDEHWKAWPLAQRKAYDEILKLFTVNIADHEMNRLASEICEETFAEYDSQHQGVWATEWAIRLNEANYWVPLVPNGVSKAIEEERDKRVLYLETRAKLAAIPDRAIPVPTANPRDLWRQYASDGWSGDAFAIGEADFYDAIEQVRKVSLAECPVNAGVGEARAAIEGEAPSWELGELEQWDYTCANGHRPIQIRQVDGLGCPLCGPAERVLEAAPQSTGFCNGRTSLCKDERCPICSGVRAAAQLPTARELRRTAGDVLRQFRESGSEDWGELESAINWWAMNEFCPNFTKGDRAVFEGRLRELAVKWRKGPWHTYTESIPEAYKEGVLDCADELERALESA